MAERSIKSAILLAATLFGGFAVPAQKIVSVREQDDRRTINAREKANEAFQNSRKYADRMKMDSAIYFAEQIKEVSHAFNYEAGIGKYHLALSFVHFYKGTPELSATEAMKAISILSRLNEVGYLGIAYWQMASAEDVAGKAESAKQNFRNSIRFLEAAGDDHNLYRSYFLLGRSFYRTSDYDSAASYYVKALTLAEMSKEPAKVFTAATELGETFLSLRNIPKAYQYLDYGFKHAGASRNKIGIWIKVNSYTICLSFLHEFARADSAIREFEKGAKQFNNAWGWITLEKLKGVQAYEKQNYEEALQHLRNAYSKIDNISANKTDIKDIVFFLARTEFKLRYYDSAISHLKSAAQQARSLKRLMDALEAELLLSESFEQLSMPDSAFYYYRRYADLKESVLSIEKQRMFAEVTTQYETEKKEQTIKMLEKESELHSYLLRLGDQEIEKHQLENEKKSQQLALALKQAEISRLDASKKALSLDNEKKENEKKQAKLQLLEKEAAFQRLLASKQNQQKNIAWASIATILVLGSYLIYRYVRRKKLQNQQEVLNERLRISRELHDEVGSTLSGIAMYSHLTKEQIKAKRTDQVEASLNNIQESAGGMIGKLSDIVWLINPEKDSFKRLMERLEEFASDIARTKNIDIKVNLDGALNGADLPVDKRRNIYLFCKEAITNAVKYSNADCIELTMKEIDHKRMGFFVTDDGKGFDLSRVKRGNGLVNMRQRAEAMSGQFSLQTEPGGGTTVSLVCKIT